MWKKESNSAKMAAEVIKQQIIIDAISANNKKWIEKIEALLIIFKPQIYCPHSLSKVSYSVECTDCHARKVELGSCFIHAWQQLKKDMEAEG